MRVPTNRLLKWAERKQKNCRPDYIIGESESDPYMERWYVIPRNPFFNIYLHCFYKSDDDRALHDHPWYSVSILLNNSLREWYKKRGRDYRHLRYIETGKMTFRSPWLAHRLVVPRPCTYTLFITGPRIREWGFHCPKGWRHWREYTAGENNRGRIGKGCD